MDTYTCSYCKKTAVYEGRYYPDGSSDGDFYCEKHKGEAPNGVRPMEDI